mgnify:CR=1
LLKKIITFKNNNKTLRKLKINQKMIKNYFYSFDGNSSERVSNELFKVLKKPKKNKKLTIYKIKQKIKKTFLIQ